MCLVGAIDVGSCCGVGLLGDSLLGPIACDGSRLTGCAGGRRFFLTIELKKSIFKVGDCTIESLL